MAFQVLLGLLCRLRLRFCSSDRTNLPLTSKTQGRNPTLKSSSGTMDSRERERGREGERERGREGERERGREGEREGGRERGREGEREREGGRERERERERRAKRDLNAHTYVTSVSSYSPACPSPRGTRRGASWPVRAGAGCRAEPLCCRRARRRRQPRTRTCQHLRCCRGLCERCRSPDTRPPSPGSIRTWSASCATPSAPPSSWTA